MHSFHKTTQDQVQIADVDQTEKLTLEEQQQLAAKPTDLLLEEGNATKSVDSQLAEDLPHPESKSEQTDIQLASASKTETQLSSREENRVDSVSGFATDQQTLDQRPAAMTSNQFVTDVCSPDSQGNPLVSLPVLDASTETNPLSPFVPKRNSMQEKRPTSDLIQFGDKAEPYVNREGTALVSKECVGAATPSEEVQPMEETNQEKAMERSLSNARQPSLESENSVVCVHFYIYHDFPLNKINQ